MSTEYGSDNREQELLQSLTMKHFIKVALRQFSLLKHDTYVWSDVMKYVWKMYMVNGYGTMHV